MIAYLGLILYPNRYGYTTQFVWEDITSILQLFYEKLVSESYVVISLLYFPIYDDFCNVLKNVILL